MRHESAQQLLKRQDDALDTLGDATARVKALAGGLKHELHEQSVMLEALDDDMERQDASMGAITQKMRSLSDTVAGSERAQMGVIGCLLLVLGVLVLMVLS